MSESGKLWSDLPPEQVEKLKTCETSEELLALAKEEGVELSDDQLEQVSGGDLQGLVRTLSGRNDVRCPECGGNQFQVSEMGGMTMYECKKCGATFGRVV